MQNILECEQIKTQLELWLRKELKIADDCMLLVSETCCNQSGNTETIFMIREANPEKIKMYKIEKSMGEVSEKDIQTKLVSKNLFKPKDVNFSNIKLDDDIENTTVHPSCQHEQESNHDHKHRHEHSARIVVWITAAVMVLEIGYGYYTNSMSLLADGWHMASHVFAIGLCWLAYFFARKHKANLRFTAGTGKILSLSGFTSAEVLLMIAVLTAIESIERFIHPEDIRFKEAIVVSLIGFLVNAISAKFLHHDHEHSDHNIRAAYLHVLADMITSIVAILSLIIAYYWSIMYLDALGGLLGSAVIIKWSIGLLRNSGKELLDYK